MYKHKLYKLTELQDMLDFLNENKSIQVISITQAKNNDYSLFYHQN